MKKLLFLSLALGALGIVAACSQSDKHPAMLGDCDVCTPNLGGGTVAEGGAADASPKDAASNDAAPVDASDASDASDDGTADASGDVELPDVGLPDVIDLDGASE